VLPVLVLVAAYPEWRVAADVPQQHIGAADAELSLREAHRSAAVAAATGLVEDHRAVPVDQPAQ
jgi:hypothetical protein